MRGSYIRKRIKGKLYKAMLREEKKYADRAVQVYKDEGYLAIALPEENPKYKGEYMVWKSVRKVK